MKQFQPTAWLRNKRTPQRFKINAKLNSQKGNIEMNFSYLEA